MSLYDKINKKVEVTASSPRYLGNAPADFVEPVMAEVPAEAGGKVYPVTDVRELQTPAPVAPVEKVPEVKPSDIRVKNHIPWWKSSDYEAAEVQAQAKAEEEAVKAENRARRQRDAAILGDLAKLGAQVYAKKGGAYMLQPFESQTAVANERLRALHDRNAAMAVEFAKRRAEAREKDRKDANDRAYLNYKLGREEKAAEAAAIAAENKKQWELYKQRKTEEHRAAQLQLQKEREERLRRQGGSGSKKNKFTVDGVTYDDVYTAYIALPDSAKKRKTDHLGQYTNVVDNDVSETDMRYLIGLYNAGKSASPAPEEVDDDFSADKIDDDFSQYKKKK